MFHEYGFGNDGTDATRFCQSHQRDDHMEEQNEDVSHAAWYQTALTSGISAGLVIRHAQANHWKKSYGIWVVHRARKVADGRRRRKQSRAKRPCRGALRLIPR